MYKRTLVAAIASRMAESDNPLIQVVTGPRQTGKSTAIAQALQGIAAPTLSVSSDDVVAPDADWIRTEWQQARNLQRLEGVPVVLVLDEIQRVEGWPNIVKGLWDADRRTGTPIKAVLSGSSALLLRKGLEDSLKGRFEVLRSTHWGFAECRDAFGFSLDDYLFYGGFPGAARFVGDERRWRAYMRDSIIEPTIARDVLEQEDIRKPALLRMLFELGARHSGQELSYNKILGQLQDAGNTTTLAHYLTLLGKAGVLCGLEKFHRKELDRKRSSPRFMVFDIGLMNAVSARPRELALGDSELRGHLVESAVGARLLALGPQLGFEVNWWRDGSAEVDFVLSGGGILAAVEVKSGRTKGQGGMAEFLKRNPDALRIVIGGSSAGAWPVEEFLAGTLRLPWE